jgi:hypothetical protein
MNYLVSSEQKLEVCDATTVDSSIVADFIIIPFALKSLHQKKENTT